MGKPKSVSVAQLTDSCWRLGVIMSMTAILRSNPWLPDELESLLSDLEAKERDIRRELEREALT